MFRRNVASLQCDAAHLPLPDESVDLIVTSPPYFALRDYQDGGGSLKGQVGNEPTPQEFLESLWACTREWMRVLKPSGSIFVNLGDKWAGGGNTPHGANSHTVQRRAGMREGVPAKCLIGLPWRYALGCVDQLGLILREEIVWSKPNGLPESAKDRCRRSHEQLFHFTRNPQYYAAIDRIREQHVRQWGKRNGGRTYEVMREPGEKDSNLPSAKPNQAGALPPSVWEIPTFPLIVPKWLKEEMESLWYELEESEKFDLDHFAAFPPALVQKVINGWSPQQVCTACGQGRFPVTAAEREPGWTRHTDSARFQSGSGHAGEETGQKVSNRKLVTILGNACACTPYTDHRPDRESWRGATGEHGNGRTGDSPQMGGRWASQDEYSEKQAGAPVREYHLDRWEPPQTTPGVVLDPFGGTGTTAIVAAIMGRRGISGDLSFDYAGRMVPWRMNDRGQMRSLLGSKS